MDNDACRGNEPTTASEAEGAVWWLAHDAQQAMAQHAGSQLGARHEGESGRWGHGAERACG